METGSVLLVTRAMHRPRSEQDRNDQFQAALGATRVEIEDGWGNSDLRLPNLERFAGVIVMLRHTDLFVGPAIDWGDYRGLRIWYEPDAFLDEASGYQKLTRGAPVYVGSFARTFRRHRFDHMLVTGRRSVQRLGEQGVPVTWLPKGYDPTVFHIVNHEGRAGMVTFGTPYLARAAVLSHLKRRGIAIERVRVDYLSLNDRLNRYQSCLVCNQAGEPRAGTVGRALRHVRPQALLRIHPGSEVMMKNFEAAAAGCAVFADWIEDMDELGFRDGSSFVGYRSFDELVEKIRHYDDNLSHLARIASAGEELCRTRHTWARRAQDLARIVSLLWLKS